MELRECRGCSATLRCRRNAWRRNRQCGGCDRDRGDAQNRLLSRCAAAPTLLALGEIPSPPLLLESQARARLMRRLPSLFPSPGLASWYIGGQLAFGGASNMPVPVDGTFSSGNATLLIASSTVRDRIASRIGWPKPRVAALILMLAAAALERRAFVDSLAASWLGLHKIVQPGRVESKHAPTFDPLNLSSSSACAGHCQLESSRVGPGGGVLLFV